MISSDKQDLYLYYRKNFNVVLSYIVASNVSAFRIVVYKKHAVISRVPLPRTYMVFMFNGFATTPINVYSVSVYSAQAVVLTLPPALLRELSKLIKSIKK